MVRDALRNIVDSGFNYEPGLADCKSYDRGSILQISNSRRSFCRKDCSAKPDPTAEGKPHQFKLNRSCTPKRVVLVGKELEVNGLVDT